MSDKAIPALVCERFAASLFWLLLSLLYCLPCVSLAGQLENSDFFRKTWQGFSEVCEEAVELAGSAQRNSRSVLEFLTLREPKYIRLLNDAQEVLASSEAEGEFREIERLRQKNRDLEKEAADLRRKRISAPDSSYNPFTDTKKSIDKKLAGIPQDMEINNSQISSLKSRILEKLAADGINLDSGELDYFLISAEGGELLRLMNMAENMRKIQLVMERELQQNPGNINLAKMYAGMYLVSLDAWFNAHDAAMRNIAGYRENLAKIREEAKESLQEARRLRSSAAPKDMANIDANIKINQKTLEVAGLYDGLLKRRSGNLADSKTHLENKLALARNTYKTIANGSSLVSLVNSGVNDFSLVINFSMPELRTIYGTGMLNAFMDISARIRAEK